MTKGERIREARKEAGYSQVALAQLIGVTKGAVSQWENDLVQDIKNDHLFRLSTHTKYSAEWLATGKGNQYKVVGNSVAETGVSRRQSLAYADVAKLLGSMNYSQKKAALQELTQTLNHEDRAILLRVISDLFVDEIRE